MSGFRLYDEFRDTQIDWVPSVPVSWHETRLQRIATIYAGGTPDRTKPEYWTDGDVPWLNSGSVNNSCITTPSEFITKEGASGGRTRWAHRGSVLVALAGQGKTKGMAARLEISSTFNQSMAAIVPDARIADYRYIHFWFSANYRSVRGLAGGDLRDGLNLQHIGGIQIPLPPLAEQRAIAKFLDRETAEIDAFIADQEKLIRLLTERRAATISHAVTRGLDPTVPTKDSGVKWLGDIPFHWGATRIRRVLWNIDQGVSPQAEGGLADDGSTGVLKAGCVNRGVFNDLEHKRLHDSFEFDETIRVAVGDLIVNRASGSPDLVGSAARVRELRFSLILSDKTFRLRPRPTANADFLELFLNSTPYRRQVLSSISGAEGLANNLPMTSLREMTLALPPVEEQLQIVGTLKRELAELDAATSDAREAIALSRERRAALISAAVTGKIDVREDDAATNRHSGVA